MSPPDWEMPPEWDTPREWAEPRDPRVRYRVCRVAFALVALGLGLLALDHTCHILQIFGVNRRLFAWIRSPAWAWAVGAPITWGTFLGSTLFLGRFDDRGWKIRSGLLVALNGLDLLFWCMRNAAVLGLGEVLAAPPVRLMEITNPLTNFIEMLLFAGMAREVALHLGRDDPGPPSLVKLASFVGMLCWIFFLINFLDIGFGAPGQIPRRLLPFAILLMLATDFLMMIAAYAATVMAAQSCYLCSLVLGDLERERTEHDPFDQ